MTAFPISRRTTRASLPVFPAAAASFGFTAMGDALAGALVAGAFTLLNTVLIIGGHHLERRAQERREDERERRKTRGQRRRRREREDDAA